MRPLSVVREWLSARWPFAQAYSLVMEEEIPGGSSFFFSFGSAVLSVFAIQAVTGVMQLFFYVPSVHDAYRSVGFLHTQVPFGWLIHGLHFWGAQVLIVLLLVHVARVFIWGAYKTPRELTWLAGVTLLLVVMAFSLTGATLPWDQKGYWAGQVSTSVAGVVPIVGKAQEVFLRGGREMGQLTVGRFFGIHVAVLPVFLVGLFTFHIVAMRRFGSAGPWDEEKRSRTGPFWPDQVFKDAVVTALVFTLLLTLVVFVPYRFSGPADPLDTSYVPKPEWNFLFLYQALKFFQGPLEPLGAVAVPGLLILFLAGLPFLDRSPERAPYRRPMVMLSGLAVAAAVTALSVAGYLSPGYGSKKAPAGTTSPAASAPAVQGRGSPAPAVEKGGAGAPMDPAAEAAYIIGNPQTGRALFSAMCAGCHGPGGRSGVPNPGSEDGTVPVLDPIDPVMVSGDPVAFAENLDRVLQHGSVPEGSPVTVMPAFGEDGTLSQQQIANLIAYIMKLNGVDRAAIVHPGMRPVTFYFASVGGLLLTALVLAGAGSRRRKPGAEDGRKGERT